LDLIVLEAQTFKALKETAERLTKEVKELREQLPPEVVRIVLD
jgi:hypothetical protein